jgi:hypothetical protein
MTGRRRACLILLMATGLATPAAATRRIYSYDSANPSTEAMTESGITFVFDKSIAGQRVLKLIETHDVGQADLIPASDRALGAGGLGAVLPPGASERDLYEITDQDDGKALKSALCHGSDRTFLAFGRLKAENDLRVHAIGYDAKAGRSRLCFTLDYTFHGEWALPLPTLPQPDRSDPFNDAPANRRY